MLYSSYICALYFGSYIIAISFEFIYLSGVLLFDDLVN